MIISRLFAFKRFYSNRSVCLLVLRSGGTGMVIEKSGYKFDVEIDATKEYDKMHSVCDCSYCRNYEAQIVEYLPRLKAFFDEVHFGLLSAKENLRLVCSGARALATVHCCCRLAAGAV